MKISEFIKDHIIEIITYIILIFIIISLLLIFNVNIYAILLIVIIMLLNMIIIFIEIYLKKSQFYNILDKELNRLDKKYLITEIIQEPSFLEGKILTNSLYEIDKSMCDELQKYKINSEEFIDYLELWCHEIKTPIATSKMIIENNPSEITSSIKEEIDKIDDFVEQVLFYARSGNVEKDYVIKKINLKDVINKVIKRNKKQLINKKIKINLVNIDYYVSSDSKWLEFIINQIINNSIKYSNTNPLIEFTTVKNKNNIILNIKDNGIGIKKEELNKVFNKSFTGTNGRLKYNSTGIGLYLCKKLCDKLNHNIIINSNLNKGTTVTIVFPNSSLIN